MVVGGAVAGDRHMAAVAGDRHMGAVGGAQEVVGGVHPLVGAVEEVPVHRQDLVELLVVKIQKTGNFYNYNNY